MMAKEPLYPHVPKSRKALILTEAKGKEIASRTGAIYRGIQKRYGTLPAMYVFNEPTTRTTFYARTEEEVKAKLIEKRRLFGK